MSDTIFYTATDTKNLPKNKKNKNLNIKYQLSALLLNYQIFTRIPESG